MALKQVRIGSLTDIGQYDDGDFNSAIETDQPMKSGAPVDANDVLRLEDLGLLYPVAIADVDNPTELATAAGSDGMMVLAYKSVGPAGLNEYTLYAYDSSGPAVSSPYIVDAAGAGNERWIAIAGKYRISTILNTLTAKNPPIDADKVVYRDSTSLDALVTSTWTQVKAFLKTYFDTLYGALGSAHTRLHSITDALDHSSTATSGQMLKADANGLPVDATNTDVAVAAAVTASHARSHAISSTSDHSDVNLVGISNNDLMQWDDPSSKWEPKSIAEAILNQAISPGNITIADENWIGQAAGPLLTFDDTHNYLEITGCNVGIGITDPLTLLDVRGAGLAVTGPGYVQQVVADSAAMAAGVGASVALLGKYTDIGDYAAFAAIKGGKENATTGNYASYMSFYTRANGATLTEQVRITSAGNVGIGSVTPVSLLELQGGTTTTGAVLTLGSKETSIVANDVLGRINFYAPLDASGTDAILPGASIVAMATASFSASVNSTALHFQTGNSETAVGQTRLYIGPTGGVCVGGTTDPGDNNLRVDGIVGIGIAPVVASGLTILNAAASYAIRINRTNTTVRDWALYVDANGDFNLIDHTGAKVALLLTKGTGAATFIDAVTVTGTLHTDGAATLASIVCEGAFGCNSKTAQTAYASGGALSAYTTGDFGYDTAAHAEEIHTLLVNIRAALVANGIMS